MVITKLSRVYAKSLIDLAEEQKSVEAVKKDLEMIGRTLKSSRDLELFLESPLLKADKKKEVLQAIFEKKVGKLTLHFLNLLVNHGREGKLEAILFAFNAEYNVRNNIQEATVTAAYTLSDKETKSIEEKLAKQLDKTIVLHQEVKPEILGGMSLRFGDNQYDGTISGRLRAMRGQFKKNYYIPEI